VSARLLRGVSALACLFPGAVNAGNACWWSFGEIMPLLTALRNKLSSSLPAPSISPVELRSVGAYRLAARCLALFLRSVKLAVAIGVLVWLPT